MVVFNNFKGCKLCNFLKYGYRLDEICLIYIILIESLLFIYYLCKLF